MRYHMMIDFWVFRSLSMADSAVESRGKWLSPWLYVTLPVSRSQEWVPNKTHETEQEFTEQLWGVIWCHCGVIDIMLTQRWLCTVTVIESRPRAGALLWHIKPREEQTVTAHYVGHCWCNGHYIDLARTVCAHPISFKHQDRWDLYLMWNRLRPER